MAVLCVMPTVKYSTQNARLSVRLFEWSLPDGVFRPRPVRQSEVPSTSVRRRRKFGEVSCTECTRQGNDSELIPAVNMETRLNVYGSYGNKFPSIYNHCGAMVA